MVFFEILASYLAFPFVRYALIVGVLTALCSSLLGVTLVLKRFSFIGDGLSHVAFGAIAIASVLNLSNEMLFVLPATVVCAVLLLRTGNSTKIKGDAAIAMISVGALAVGYLLMHLFSTSTNLSGDVCSTLFGSTSILTLTISEVILCVILSIAVIIVLAMNLVGSLLISALVIFPALSAMRVFKSFYSVTVCSAILSVVCTLIGMIISIVGGTPVGSTIVAVDIAAFLAFALVGKVRGE